MNTVPGRISLKRIKEAVNKIDPIFINSPQYLSEPLSHVLETKIFLKIETENPICSFKGRGTEVLIWNVEDEAEIVCASAGNFGQAMAYSCRKKMIKLTVFASIHANPLKIKKMRSLEANVILEGNDFDEAKNAARLFSERKQIRFVEDSFDIETVEGAGTIGLELLNLPEKLDCLLIALGNGALITGIAKVYKELSPQTKIIAIQAAGAPAMIHSWKSGELINYPQVDTIADGIAVRLPVPQILKDMNGLIDDGVLVKDINIIKAMKLLHQHAGLVVEPSAAVGIAAIIENIERFKDKRIGTIICGGNITDDQKKEWF